MASEVNTFVDDEYMNCLYVLDSSYNVKMMLDTFTDLLWTERYCGYGEFEITTQLDQRIVDTCHVNDYVTIKESDVIMVIDTIAITNDSVDGSIIKISGRSLETILDRRIIIDEKIGTIDGQGNPSPIGVQEVIQIILNNNLINPSESRRRIAGFSMKLSSDSKITRLVTESFQERGSIVYDKILKLCQDNNLGFRVNGVNEGAFQFELYFGVDRSRSQSSVPVVVFSDSYENLPHSEYLNTEQEYRNVIYIDWNYKYNWIFVNHDEDNKTSVETFEQRGSEVSVIYKNEAVSGLFRRETYMNDGTEYDVGSIVYPTLPPPDFSGAEKQVASKGKENLASFKAGTYFEGDVEPNRQFIYGRDYFLGDIVQLEGQYGLNARCRITEIMRSHSASGASMVPTFEIIE